MIRVAHVATVDLTHRFLLLDQLRRQRDEGYEVTAISSAGPWVDDLRREGIGFIPWAITRAWDPPNDARAFVELVRILRRESVHVVHTHKPKGGVLGRVAGADGRSPVRGEHRPRPLRDAGGPRSAAMAGARRRVAGREVQRSRALPERRGPRVGSADPHRATVPERPAGQRRRPDAVRSRRRRPGRRRARSDPGWVCRPMPWSSGRSAGSSPRRGTGSCSRLPERCAARSRRSGSSPSGTRTARSPMRSRRVEQEAASKDVIFAGWREDVRDLLGAFDIFVLPSWREGLPRSAIEAAAMGTPLVLTDIRGCREVVTDGLEGVLVPVRDPRRLAEAILELARDPERRARMGAAARVRATQRFDERRVADLVLSQYRRLLSRRGFRAPVPEASAGDREQRGGTDAGPSCHPTGRVVDVATASRVDADGVPPGARRPVPPAPLRGPRARPRGGGAGGGGPARDPRFRRRRAVGSVVLPSFHPSARGAGLGRRDPRTRQAGNAPTRAGVARLPGHGRGPAGSGAPVDRRGPRARTRGVGRALVEGVAEGLRERGVDELKVVVGTDNEPANAFYERVGFEHRARIAVHDGVASNVWTLRCRS